MGARNSVEMFARVLVMFAISMLSFSGAFSPSIWLPGPHPAAICPAGRVSQLDISSGSGVVMRCRTNMKREKRQRNRENSRKYRKASGKGRGGKGRGGKGIGSAAPMTTTSFNDDGWFKEQIFQTLGAESVGDA